MLIYSCLLTDGELFSDAFTIHRQGPFYKISIKKITKKSDNIDESLIGGNKSAEDPDECEVDDSPGEKVYDVVDQNNLLVLPDFSSKKEVLMYGKEYFKSLKEKIAETEKCPTKLAEYEARAKEAFKYLTANFKDLEVLAPDNQWENKVTRGFVGYEENGIDAFMLVFADGVRSIKT